MFKQTTHENSGRKSFGPALSMLAFVVIAGCASQGVRQIDKLDSISENPRIILMPPDIKYYLVTAGGIPQPHAEWTDAARINFAGAVRDFAVNRGTDLTVLDEESLDDREIQYRKLHAAVGTTLIRNYFGGFKLPTKQDNFDWSLGSGIHEIGQKRDADYAMFVFYRDYQASGGRVLFAILAAAYGNVLPTGQESGFASLVDLESGDIVWFNVVWSGSGELRNADGAAAAVNALFKDIPAN
ncbi:MAG: hypothetical protein ACE5OQ_06945 [Woeseia sp.]